MRTKTCGTIVWIGAFATTSAMVQAAPIGTAFTYQGQLQKDGQRVDAVCNFEFRLWDASAAGNPIGTPVSKPGQQVTEGLFTVSLDFGVGAINGEARWLAITVQCPGDALPTTLTPRQELKPAPHALALPGLYTQQNATSPNVIGGYRGNSAGLLVVGATIAGGGRSDDGSGGPDNNRVYADWGTIGGGKGNESGALLATVGGGFYNSAGHIYSTVGGGYSNAADGFQSTVAGGFDNIATGDSAAIAGGVSNTADGNRSSVGGGIFNAASGSYSSVGGGATNTAEGNYATVAGGDGNTASTFFATACGGIGNTASGISSTASGGFNNTAIGNDSTVGGGYRNEVSGSGGATIGGGYLNVADGRNSTIAGGYINTADGDYATVPGGALNEAGGEFSLAAGFRALVRDATQSSDSNGDEGTFVWADSTDADFESTGPNQFLIRAGGGVGINTNAPAEALDVSGNIHASGTIASGSSITIDGTAHTISSDSALELSAPGGVGIGTTSPAAQLDVNGAARTTTLEITGGLPLGATLVGWGSNHGGQIEEILLASSAFIAVTAGHQHTVAIRTDGTLVGWGEGQTNVPAGTFIAIDATGMHTLAIRSDGTLAGWGDNSYGQTNVPSGTFIAVAAGGNHSLAIQNNGTLVGWGYNSSGQINVPPGVFGAVAAGASHSLAIYSDGTLAAWGYNYDGQANVPPGTFTAIAAGYSHNLAIRTDGSLVGWGDNGYGQTDVPSGTFVAIAAGLGHSLAIRDDGTLVGWGLNSYGQVDVPLGMFGSVAAGGQHSLAIRPDTGGIPSALVLHNDSAYKPGSNTWTIFSDRRLKKNIEPLSGALEGLLQLNGVTFQWLDPASQGGITGMQMGLIADEVQRAFPQWVGRDAKGYQTLTVSGFEALTAEALRELRAEKDRQITELKDHNRQLEGRLANLERVLANSGSSLSQRSP